MTCERDSFGDIGGVKETLRERISLARNSLVLQTSDTFSIYDYRPSEINHNNYELKCLISFLRKISTRNQSL